MPTAPSSSTDYYRSHAPSHATPGPAWASTSPAPSPTPPPLPSRGTSPGFSHPTPETAWHASRPTATRHRWRQSARRWKRPSASNSRATAAPHSSVRRWSKRSSTASSPHGCCGPDKHPRQSAHSIGARRSGICAPRCCGRCFSSSPTPAVCNRWASSRCSTGPPRRWTASTGTPSSTASTRARPSVLLRAFPRSLRPRPPQAARRLVHANRGRPLHGRSRRPRVEGRSGHRRRPGG